MRMFVRWLALLAAWSVSSVASALACGDAVSHSIILVADLVCPGHPYALEVVGQDVTVELNGKRIRAPNGIGIVVADVDRVTIRGPGTIEARDTGIRATRSQHLSVTDVAFTGDGPRHADIELIDSAYATLQRNRTETTGSWPTHYSVYVEQGIDYPGGHVIAESTFSGVLHGIHVLGAGAGGNSFTRNIFREDLRWYSIWGYGDGSRIEGNKFAGGTALLFSDANVVRDNEVGPLGSMGFHGDRNRIEHNRAYDSGHAPFEIDGTWNIIRSNTIFRARIGILLGARSSHNDARGNAYPGTTTRIYDLGVDNVY